MGRAKILLILTMLVLASGCVTQLEQTNQQNTSTQTNTPGQNVPPGPETPPLPPPAQPNSPDKGALGSLNHGYLRAEPYKNIIIEIDYISGYEPTSATKSALSDFFQNVAGKSVTFAGGNMIATTKSVYTVSDLVATEKANRRYYTTGDTAVVYMMFLNGQYESAGALGVAFKASTAALFVERINDATSALVLYAQIEKAVAVHELGHLMGLVNINYASERPHEDPQHKGHSSNQDSVMFWAVEDVTINTILNFGPPSEFDSDDLFDLQKIKDGVY
ncbi:MAG TPA: hypothetical protein VJH04_01510 [archaeon]|nr:hypothetical protein [archaeon]